jgi:hypothetical protein
MRHAGAFVMALAAMLATGPHASAQQAAGDGGDAETRAEALMRDANEIWVGLDRSTPVTPHGEAHAARLNALRRVDATLRRIVEIYPATPLARRLAAGGSVGDLSMARSSLAIEQFLAETCDP